MSSILNALPQIIKSLKSSHGSDFLNSITLELNKCIGATYTFVARVDPEKYTATSLSMVANGEQVENFEYELNDTPCEVVTNESVCVYPRGICHLFPKDQLLIDMKIEGYIGVALHDTSGQLIGIVVALHEKEIENPEHVTALFELFSGRIAAEMERSQQEKRLEELNQQLESKLTELKASEQRLASHLENTPLGCITWDQSFHCIEWNKAAEHIFGYSAQEAIGKHAAELIVPEEIIPNINDIFQLLLDQKGGSRSTNDNITKFGKRITCDWYNTPLVNKDGHVSGVSSLIHDITEQKQQEKLLHRTQKMDALGKIAGGVAHDQNNILGIILGFSELLSFHLSSDSKLHGYVENIEHAAHRGTQLISKLLSLYRANVQDMASVNINDVLLAQRDMLQKTLTVQISLEFDLASDVWTSWLNANELEDVILNLTINAKHAIESQNTSGQIVIKSNNVTLDESQAANIGTAAGDYVELCVEDNGCGIDDHDFEKIFDPFYSTKGDKGTGLGLSQVFSFTQRIKGGVSVESHLGKGTRITLYLPRKLNSTLAPSATTSSSGHATPRGNETILVVEDEDHLRDMCRELLELKGYQVHVANGKKQALEILENTPIDLVFSDVIMPETNGYELANEILEKYPSMKILLTSGFYDDKKIVGINEQLERFLLPKPYDKDTLYSRIKETLDQR